MIPAITNPTLQAFLTSESFIFETVRWVLVLRPKQATLGATVLINKSELTRVTDLPLEDVADLHVAWQKIGKMYDATFQPDKLNHLALMMVDPNPHFHILPRYAAKRAFDGGFYDDPSWPKPPDLGHDISMTAEQREKLRKLLQEAAS